MVWKRVITIWGHLARASTDCVSDRVIHACARARFARSGPLPGPQSGSLVRGSMNQFAI